MSMLSRDAERTKVGCRRAAHLPHKPNGTHMWHGSYTSAIADRAMFILPQLLDLKLCRSATVRTIKVDQSSTQFKLDIGPSTLQRCSRGPGGRGLLITLWVRFHLIQVFMKLLLYSSQSLKSRPPVLRSFEDMRYTPLSEAIEHRFSLLIAVPTLERKLMFTYRHVGQSTCPLTFHIGRSLVASCIRHPTTSQSLKNI